ncbi:MAG: ABC transporter, partial [Singulisphaera sp.]
AEEVAKLKAYADRGGRLLVIAGNSEKTGLEEFLKSFHVEVGPGLIVDPRLNYNRRVQIVFAPIVGSTRHPIVDSLANRTVLLPFAAPIRIRNASATDPPANPGVLATPILRTSDASWVETDPNAPRVERGETEERGPLTVGVAVADRPRPGAPAEGAPRLVLVSSRYVADNQSLELEPTNLDLLMNAVNWLRGRPELRGIAPKTHVALALSADPSMRLRLVLVPTLMAILVIIGLGVTTYMARRE